MMGTFCQKGIDIDKYTKNKLCTKLDLLKNSIIRIFCTSGCFVVQIVGLSGVILYLKSAIWLVGSNTVKGAKTYVVEGGGHSQHLV